MEERHRRQEHGALTNAHAIHHVRSVVHQPAMFEVGTFGETSRPGRVLDHHRVRWKNVWQLFVKRVSGGQEVIPVVKADDFPQPGTVWLNLFGGGQHWITPETRNDEQRRRAGLLEYVRNLVTLEPGIDRDQNDAGERSTELEQNPFGSVVRPNCHAITLLEPHRQCARGPQRLIEEFLIGPLTASVGVRDSFDQRNAIGHRCCRFTQQITDRDVSNRRVGGPDGV
jgi:hypothetical protein